MTTFTDGDDGFCNAQCTLREAVNHLTGNAVITLSPGIYDLTLGALELTDAKEIRGAEGARETAISGAGNGDARVVTVLSGTPTLKGVTITDGETSADGGGIFVEDVASLTLEESTVADNSAELTGGIYTEGALTVRRSTIEGNDASLGAGGIYADATAAVTLIASTVSGNSATEGVGGIYTNAATTLRNVTLAGNDGGGIEAGAAATTDATAVLLAGNGTNCDEALDAAVDTIADDNSCGLPVGQVVPEALIAPLDWNGGTTRTHALRPNSPAYGAATTNCEDTDQRGLPAPRDGACEAGAYEALFAIAVSTTSDNDHMCTVTDCSLRSAVTYAAPEATITIGTGTYSLTEGQLLIERSLSLSGTGAQASVIESNGDARVLWVADGDVTVTGIGLTGGDARAQSPASGGGAYVDSGASLSLIESVVEGNEASLGGGIGVEGGVWLVSSTVSGNTAGPLGGGLFVDEFGYAEVVNSTLSQNTAVTTGGGIANSGGDVELRHATIADNSLVTPGPGAAIAYSRASDGDGGFVGSLTARNTLVAGDADAACSLVSGGLTWTAGVVEDESCPGTPKLGVQIGPLSLNARQTLDHELLSGNPAIDAGDPAFCEVDDQRGVTRALPCDVGATEADASVHVTTEADGDDGACDAHCTLREALIFADGEPISLPSGIYRLNGNPLIATESFTLTGGGANSTYILGDGSGVFDLVDGESVIEGVTIAQGSGEERGGGILVRGDAHLRLLTSVVQNNQASDGAGIYVEGPGSLEAVFSTLLGNAGDALAVALGGHASLVNSTVSGNTRGIYSDGGTVTLAHSTVVNNTGPALIFSRENSQVELTHTILGGGCANVEGGPTTPVPLVVHSLTDSPSCFAAVTGDLGLGELGDHGGTTPTHVPRHDSPAVDGGVPMGGPCEVVDQRGLPRVGNACDIGAVEFGPGLGVLNVRTLVSNDNGATLGTNELPVHVRLNGVDVDGSPAVGNGDTGVNHDLAQGNYVVAGTSNAGYTVSYEGACAPDGTVSVYDSLQAYCVVTYDDVAPQQQPPPSGGGGNQPPPPPPPPGDEPVAGETVVVEPSGTVKVKLPGTNRFVTLAEGESLPVGTIVDTLKGRVTLTAAGGQTATFYDGVFRITQGKGARPLTVLTLVEALSCPKGGKASTAAKKKKKKRRLWGDGSGRFQTKGKHSAATVVGTRWLVEDTCTTTLTRVVRGKVSVRDFVKRKTVTVKAGKSYTAKAKKKR